MDAIRQTKIRLSAASTFVCRGQSEEAQSSRTRRAGQGRGRAGGCEINGCGAGQRDRHGHSVGVTDLDSAPVRFSAYTTLPSTPISHWGPPWQ